MSVKKLPKNPSLLIESKGLKWLIVIDVETRENRRDGADGAVTPKRAMKLWSSISLTLQPFYSAQIPTSDLTCILSWLGLSIWNQSWRGHQRIRRRSFLSMPSLWARTFFKNRYVWARCSFFVDVCVIIFGAASCSIFVPSLAWEDCPVWCRKDPNFLHRLDQLSLDLASITGSIRIMQIWNFQITK